MPPEKETDKPDTPTASRGDDSKRPSKMGSIQTFFFSPGAKFILLGVIIFALLIPTLMVWALVEERSQRAETVARQIAQGWGGPQIINGPYLVMPYTQIEKVPLNDNNTRLTQDRLVTRHAIFSPDRLEMGGNIEVEERKKSIYKTQLYHFKNNLKGSFADFDMNKIREAGGTPKPANAFLVIGISDTTGFRSDIMLKVDGKSEGQFLPGLNSLGNTSHVTGKYNRSRAGSGIHIPISTDKLAEGFDFEISMALNGSRNIAFVPAGKTTQLDIQSNWPHPGFSGKFLPEERDITAEGFAAKWTIPNLARGISEVQLSSQLSQAGTSIGVNFVEPLSFYQVTSRSLKYAVGFFSLVFLAVFILELYGKSSLHWIQYILTGLAMIIFYVLLLALAEQVGFLIAYGIAAVATTILIAWYVGDALGNKNGSAIVGSVLATTYLVMYMILNEDTYALLAGSLIAFIAIAATMFATRKIDWAGQSASVEAQ